LAASAGPEIERLISLLSKLPGLGPRSARRSALALLKRRDQLLVPLADALAEAAARVKVCASCGSLDTQLWAMERASAFRGRYHVLGGLLSALDGVGPDALRVNGLVTRATDGAVREVILALPATVDGQTTAHYLADRLANAGVSVTMLARGVPVGGELDWLDDGTIAQAMRARRPA